MALAEINYNGQPYKSLATVAQANTALAVTEFADQWSALDDSEKTRRLVVATRLVRSFPQWTDLDSATRGVVTAVSRLAIATPETPRDITQLNAGGVSLRFRRVTDVELLDADAVRMLNTAASLSTGGGYTAGALETSPSSFDSYAGANP